MKTFCKAALTLTAMLGLCLAGSEAASVTAQVVASVFGLLTFGLSMLGLNALS